MLIDDQHVTFVEGTIRRSVGMAMIELGAARESNGGTAERAQILGQIGPVNVNAQALIANDFHLNGGELQSVHDYSVFARCAAETWKDPSSCACGCRADRTNRSGTKELVTRPLVFRRILDVSILQEDFRSRNSS